MNRETIPGYQRKVDERVSLVLRTYCLESGCPCGRNPFVYWTGKDQGPGWQDNIQNSLVKAALSLDCFEQIATDFRTYGYEDSWLCSNCGTLWHHISIEWRMLAFHERLVMNGEPEPDHLYPDLISDSIAATVGYQPGGREVLSLDQWAAFMLERSDKTE